jgi:2',3'-cyclic-nucleotide 2'-phosphodiesterase/3'-nucleotidase
MKTNLFKSHIFSLIFLLLTSCTVNRKVNLAIIETTDIHGVVLPYDFIEKKSLDASQASTFTYVRKVRQEKDATVLLDDGDNLQGQPEVYYYNYIDTVTPHLVPEVMNYMQYDAATAGNHDIETGHAVYDRLVKMYDFPLLAANAVDIKTGKPYFRPYCIIKKKGIKIAVLGLITPAIPNWLPDELYKGIEFEDMVSSAKKWMPEILAQKPDLVIGLFHSGWDKSEEEQHVDNQMLENGSAAVAYNVPGFDIILAGHDHRPANEKFVNRAGDTILVLDGGSHSQKVAEADIFFSGEKINGRKVKRISGKLINVADYKPDVEFMAKFKPQFDTVSAFVNRVIGTSGKTISSRDAYFGPSAFVGMIHSVQLAITGADISFAAPLSFDVQIAKGPVTVGDMFKLYRFENMLYTMTMSGEEVRKYLEYSYAGWLNTIKKPGDLLLRLRAGKDGKPVLVNGRAMFRNQPYNFDSASGINYTVDVTKPAGSRVHITGMSDGRPFIENKTYRIAVNSYRGNGGGGHFVMGAGIRKEDLRSRVIASTDRDLRYFIMKYIEERKIINPAIIDNWKIIPERLVNKEIPTEYALLFGAK